MSNLNLKKPSQFAIKNGRFPDDGKIGIELPELRLMPNSAHLSCPQCGNCWMGLTKRGDSTFCECSVCSWGSPIHFSLFTDTFSGSCPKCKTDYFVIVKLSGKLVLGCKKCSWENTFSLEEESTSGLILPN